MKTGSKLSVLIAGVNGLPILRECLNSLRQQSNVEQLEVIVANRCAEGVAEVIYRDYPWVKLINALAATTIPELRVLAFRESSGEMVAVLEDHCLVGPDWAERMMRAHEGGHPVVGGSIENGACERLVDWAVFFCEYSAAMNPIPAGEVDAVPGNNVSYERWVLELFQKNMEAGEWDFILHERMKASGIPLYSVPSITVRHKMSRDLAGALLQKFHFARSFAGMRFAGRPQRLRRAFHGLGAIFLPILMGRRIIACVWKKGNHRPELLLSSPILMMLLLSWGLGEATGYIFGAGSSSAKVA